MNQIRFGRSFFGCVALCACATYLLACGSSSDDSASPAGSASASAGAGATGSAPHGGASAAGAPSTSGASAGGTSASGGSTSLGGTSFGGASPSGGTSARGGTNAMGGGGASASGGSNAMGGGGASPSGGTSALGGRDGSGGNPATTSALPAHVVAGYYPNWTPSPVRIKDVNASYNVIYLFAATPVGGAPGTTGAVSWDKPGDGRGAATNFNADIAYARGTQHRKIILSIGGAGNGMSFPNRTKSQTFVDSVAALYAQFGGFDGLDWNTFEGNQAPDTNEMIWISLELKKRYAGFIISAPPAPWNSVDKTFCQAMVQAGALDYAAPQYYDGPDLATQSYMVQNVAEWVKLVGADKLVVGFGIADQTNYMKIADAVATWKALEQATPTLRGAFDWQIHTDEAQGWPFATQLAPLVLQ